MGKTLIDLSQFHQSLMIEITKTSQSDEKLHSFLAGPDFKKLLEETSDEMAGSLAENLSTNSEAQLAEEISQRKSFEERNQARWREGFAYMTALIASCTELGEAVNLHFQNNTRDIGPATSSALTTLHARCLRVANEAFSLMRCGFADGAYSRWRTMHEIYATCLFITKTGEDIATRYQEAWHLKALKRAKEYRRYEQILNLRDFDDSEFRELERHNKRLSRSYEDELKSDWGWARPALNGKDRINFSDIQDYVGLDHWRPYISMAHQEIHAGFVPPDKGLGVSEADGTIHLVGPSNAGMMVPVQNISITLTGITSVLLSIVPTLDTIAFIKALKILSDGTLPRFQIGERRSDDAGTGTG